MVNKINWKKDLVKDLYEFPAVETLEVDDEFYDRFISQFPVKKEINKTIEQRISKTKEKNKIKKKKKLRDKNNNNKTIDKNNIIKIKDKNKIIKLIDKGLGETIDSGLNNTIDQGSNITIYNRINETIDNEISKTIGCEIKQTINKGLYYTIDKGLSNTIGTGLNKTIDNKINETIDQELNKTIDQGLNYTINQGLSNTIGTRLNNTIDNKISKTITKGLNNKIETIDRGLNNKIDTGLNSTIDKGLDKTIDNKINKTIDQGFDYTTVTIDKGLNNKSQTIDKGLNNTTQIIDKELNNKIQTIDKGLNKTKQIIDKGLNITIETIDKGLNETIDNNDLINNSPWLNLGVPIEIIKILIKNNLINPTPIQFKCLSETIKLRKDSVIAAETGSGKTLLYLIPILTKCLEIRKFSENPENKLRALILTPTRELAVQVKNMFFKISNFFNVFCLEIIGGISDIKQSRLLTRRPEVIVGTPGRLWSFFESAHAHISDLTSFKLLVIDEVDKMTEKGHYNQLQKIINFLTLKNNNFVKYILSATLNSKSFNINDKNFISKILNLKKFNIYDLSKIHLTPENLAEYKIFSDEKKLNIYLYLILLKSKKTIIFVPTIKICNWLAIFLKILNINVLKINSGMTQKNRLILFEKFNLNNGVLLATDVAARGLDFPDIDTILHFSVPSSPDTYVHRSGRTARQLKKGRSILLVTPEGLSAYKKILEHLGRSEDLPEFEVDYKAQMRLQPVIDACVKLTDKCYKLQKKENNNRWFKEKAKACETVIDGDFAKSFDPDMEKNGSMKKEIMFETKMIQKELSNIRYKLDF